jgi:hypothetical protein
MVGKRTTECPEKVFTLPLSLNFSINGVKYSGEVLKIIFQQKEDSMLIEHVKWHLTPEINWNDLTKEIENAE